ncbi:MAG: DUF4290 domain-containing protein [Prevotella sp.]|nr:DUF4290 domain-containing protein [Bacteroides sp.]MCM1365647.1 DUF4290 domain-containing protein [Prevotella sp.]
MRLEYNTSLKKLVMPEFGRNVQSMVDYCVTIEDREERTRCARRIVRIMSNLFPELLGENGDTQNIWNHIMIISDFKLDVDFPCEIIREESLNPKPQDIPYITGPIRRRVYGRHIQNMITKVAQMPAGEEKDLLISMIAHHMKKLMLIHNKEGVDDAIILRDLAEFSKGAIMLDPEKYILHEFLEEPETNVHQGKGKKKK